MFPPPLSGNVICALGFVALIRANDQTPYWIIIIIIFLLKGCTFHEVLEPQSSGETT